MKRNKTKNEKLDEGLEHFEVGIYGNWWQLAVLEFR